MIIQHCLVSFLAGPDQFDKKLMESHFLRLIEEYIISVDPPPPPPASDPQSCCLQSLSPWAPAQRASAKIASAYRFLRIEGDEYIISLDPPTPVSDPQSERLQSLSPWPFAQPGLCLWSLSLQSFSLDSFCLQIFPSSIRWLQS